MSLEATKRLAPSLALRAAARKVFARWRVQARLGERDSVSPWFVTTASLGGALPRLVAKLAAPVGQELGSKYGYAGGPLRPPAQQQFRESLLLRQDQTSKKVLETLPRFATVPFVVSVSTMLLYDTLASTSR
jgi:hypothetical protein